jgi:hypothetical protein
VWRNSYPVSVNTRGFTRVLASNNASAISPSAIRNAIAGTGIRVGRFKTDPSAFVNSKFVIGSGATMFTGPAISGVVMQ